MACGLRLAALLSVATMCCTYLQSKYACIHATFLSWRIWEDWGFLGTGSWELGLPALLQCTLQRDAREPTVGVPGRAVGKLGKDDGMGGGGMGMGMGMGRLGADRKKQVQVKSAAVAWRVSRDVGKFDHQRRSLRKSKGDCPCCSHVETRRGRRLLVTQRC